MNAKLAVYDLLLNEQTVTSWILSQNALTALPATLHFASDATAALPHDSDNVQDASLGSHHHEWLLPFAYLLVC